MNWLQLGTVQLHWVHEISQGALAAAVATLGVVILLELRSIARLRRAVDGHLSRLFEQLDLLRFESQQMAASQGQPLSTRTAVTVPAVSTPTVAGSAAGVPAPYTPPMGSGEARLMAAIAAARARLGRGEGGSPTG